MHVMKIALIHATCLSIAPIEAALQSEFERYEWVNILDDSLSRDRLLQNELTDNLVQRITRLADYADSLEVDAILFTCSAFAEAIEQVARSRAYPVLKPNQGMLSQAVLAYQNIGIVSSFAATERVIGNELRQEAEKMGKVCSVSTELSPLAMEALANGNAQQHNQELLLAARQLIKKSPNIEAILLAQYSTAQAAPLLRSSLNVPVLTSPESAVLELKARLTD